MLSQWDREDISDLTKKSSLGDNQWFKKNPESSKCVKVPISEAKSILKGRMKNLVAQRKACALYGNKSTALHFLPPK